MAYAKENLSVLAYANGFTLWHYTTPDEAAAVDNAGYFDDAAGMLHAGDMVLANTETGGSAKAGLFLVASASAGGRQETALDRAHASCPAPPGRRPPHTRTRARRSGRPAGGRPVRNAGALRRRCARPGTVAAASRPAGRTGPGCIARGRRPAPDAAMTGRSSMADAVRAAVRDAVRDEAKALGLLGNGDRERLIRMEERHRTVEQRVEAIEAKIDGLAGEIANELRARDERADKRFVSRAEASDALGDVRKVRWMIVAAVVAAMLAAALQGKAAL